MKNLKFVLLPVVAGLMLVIPAALQAQRGDLSAKEAVAIVNSQFGPTAVEWIAEIRGNSGVPQPADWQIVALDERSPQLLRRFWAGGGRSGDEGEETRRYPLDIPVGYFNVSQLGVDSVAAFTIAEGEARKAKVGFDSCNYLLRVRDFSSEPVWRLELMSSGGRINGKVYISGRTGQVYRTMWVYRDQNARPDGMPRIIDTAIPRGGLPPATTGITGSDLTYREGLSGQNSGITESNVPMQPYSPIGSEQLERNNPVVPAPPTQPVVRDRDQSMLEIPAPPPAPGSVTSNQPTFPDLREQPQQKQEPEVTKPPVEVPNEGSSGSTGRIPPPPIPQ